MIVLVRLRLRVRVTNYGRSVRLAARRSSSVVALVCGTGLRSIPVSHVARSFDTNKLYVTRGRTHTLSALWALSSLQTPHVCVHVQFHTNARIVLFHQMLMHNLNESDHPGCTLSTFTLTPQTCKASHCDPVRYTRASTSAHSGARHSAEPAGNFWINQLPLHLPSV